MHCIFQLVFRIIVHVLRTVIYLVTTLFIIIHWWLHLLARLGINNDVAALVYIIGYWGGNVITIKSWNSDKSSVKKLLHRINQPKPLLLYNVDLRTFLSISILLTFSILLAMRIILQQVDMLLAFVHLRSIYLEHKYLHY